MKYPWCPVSHWVHARISYLELFMHPLHKQEKKKKMRVVVLLVDPLPHHQPVKGLLCCFLPQVGRKAISGCTLTTPTRVSRQTVSTILLHWSGLRRSTICQDICTFQRMRGVVPLHMLRYESHLPRSSAQSECFHLSQKLQTLHCSTRNTLEGCL